MMSAAVRRWFTTLPVVAMAMGAMAACGDDSALFIYPVDPPALTIQVQLPQELVLHLSKRPGRRTEVEVNNPSPQIVSISPTPIVYAANEDEKVFAVEGLAVSDGYISIEFKLAGRSSGTTWRVKVSNP